ncbi:MAG TPA: serine/threonine-protein kinase [Gemmataceae bacterium]|jgi:serine/threonine protein kinase|nr:serine/threonine-protein kinase [Gemmataceae bacterium]
MSQPFLSTTNRPRAAWVEREALIEAFETAYLADAGTDLAGFLPPPGHPHRLPVLEELVRIDLEHHWAGGLPRWVEEYRPRFPELFCDSDALTAVAVEECRLRRRAGQTPAADEYRRRLGVELPADSGAELYFDPDAPHDGIPLHERVELPSVGDEFLGYQLRAELGAGACGRVFLAERDGGLFALKVSPDLGGEPAALARLRHPNIVPVEAVHHDGPVQAVAMPYLGATTLVHVLRHVTFRRGRPTSGAALFPAFRSGLPAAANVPDGRRRSLLRLLGRMPYVEAVFWLATRLTAGLAHAHARGVLHRDLKPANVLLADDGRPLLLDFNLAGAEDGGGLVGGTWPYMAPEALEAFLGRPRRVDERADLYSLGVILYQLLAGRLPYGSPCEMSQEGLATALEERMRTPPSIRQYNSRVSPAAEAVVRRLLDPDPARRYPSARRLQKELVRCMRRPAPPDRPADWLRRPLGPIWQVGLITTLLVFICWLISLYLLGLL